MKRLLLSLFVLGSALAPLHGQSFWTSPARYLEPDWRGDTGTEYSWWDAFYSNYDGINYPDMEAPNGVGGWASNAGFTPPANSNPSDPYAFWHASNPTLKQTGTPTAFIIPVAGNIYSFAAPTAYELADTTTYSLGSVVLQFQTDGSLMDFDSIKLVTSGGQEYAPANFITEYQVSSSAMGGVTNRTAAQWNLTGLNITSYKIVFHSRTSSNSLQEMMLDTTPTYAEAVPSARTWNTPSGSWGAGANWSGGTVGPVGGNIVVAGGSSVTIDGGTREIGELKLNATGAFAIAATDGGVLKINTGITAKPSAAAHYTINAPVELGAYNISSLNANTTIDFHAPISGNTGMEFYGGGKVRLKANNTFTGGLVLDGGTLEIEGTNSYQGSTTVYSGSLIVKAAAPASSDGALGNTSSAVGVGSGGTFGDPEAALLIEGAHTVGRDVRLSAGADAKTVGGRDTEEGAKFSGNLLLNSTASNVRLYAEDADDVVTFSGAITGGSATGTLTKTGAGTVIFEGGTKNYLNHTIVAEGTLISRQSVTLRSLTLGSVPLADASPGTSAVPEPSSALLLFSGAALLLRRWRGQNADGDPPDCSSDALL